MSEENHDNVEAAAQEALRSHQSHQKRQLVLWFGALIVGAILGWLGIQALNDLFNFIATVFTRLFQFIAVPTIALAVITTLARLGAEKDTGRIFAHAVTYTLLTTISAAAVGLVLYLWIAPGNLPADIIGAGAADVPMQKLGSLSYYDHFLSVIPNNLLQPFLAGNVLSVMLIAAAVGLALAFMPKTENRAALLKVLLGGQELLFTLIRALLWALPLGILAFSAQLSAQIEAGVIVGALGKYTAVVLGGNAIQFFIVLPLFLVARPCLQEDGAGTRCRALHEELGRHAACDARFGGKPPQGQPDCFALRAAHLHDHQHEWLRGVHPRDLALRHAERRLRPFHRHDDHLALHRRPRGCRQCWRPDGLLLPDAFPHELHST